MNNGIKPTRLYRLTGMKHFRSILKDKHCSAPPYMQRDKKDFLQLVAIAVASTLGFASTFGAFQAQKTPTTIIRKCDVSKSIKPKCKAPAEPCLPKPDPPMKPCTKED